MPSTFWMEVRKVFARNLRHLRKVRNLSQEELAYEAGIDRTYVSALERQIYSVSIDTLAKLAKVLQVDPSELLVQTRKSRIGF
jgi:transcriptional regulator with XRE-family HTH domain